MTYDEYMKIKGLKRISIGLKRQQAEFAMNTYFERSISTKISIQRSSKTAGLFVLQAEVDPPEEKYFGAVVFMRWVLFQFPEAQVAIEDIKN